MLKVSSKSISMQVISVVDDVDLAAFASTVSSDGENAGINQSIIDKDGYIANIDAVNADRVEFQNMMFEAQNELMKNLGGASDNVEEAS